MRRDADLVRYYSARAAEYEQVYSRPERQRDLATLRRRATAFAAGERVLELACGTGYWTRVMAETATEIHAVDASLESVEIARSRAAPNDGVTFEVADLYELDIDPNSCSSVVTGFFWSHVPRQDIAGFLGRLAVRLGPGTRALFFDNRHVEGSSSPIVHRDRHGNGFQTRRLESGETFTIIKNFPTRSDLLESAGRVASDARVEELRYFWLLHLTFGQFTTPDSPRLRSA